MPKHMLMPQNPDFAGLSSVPAWLVATEVERQEAIASNSKVRLNANAEMAAAAARNQPTAKRRRTTDHYFEPDGQQPVV